MTDIEKEINKMIAVFIKNNNGDRPTKVYMSSKAEGELFDNETTMVKGVREAFPKIQGLDVEWGAKELKVE